MKKIISVLCFLIGAILLFIRFAPTPSTQTAIVPTYTALPTYTPAATYTAMPTYTALPTHTPLPTDTPQPTKLLPTLQPRTAVPQKPTELPNLPVNGIDQKTINYFKTTYSVINGHVINFSKFNAKDENNLGKLSYVQIAFDLDTQEYQYLYDNMKKEDLHAWGESILADMKKHWPGRSVVAQLAWVYFLDDAYYSESDCSSTGDEYIPNVGFYHIRYLVKAHDYPDIPSSEIKVCQYK